MNEIKKYTVEPFLLGIGLLFFVMLLVNGVFIYYSLHSFTGLVTEKAYDEGLAFNQAIRAKRDQDALGWQGEVVTELRAGLLGSIQLAMKERGGAPLAGARVQAVLFRPIQAGFDQELSLTEIRPGFYRGEVTVMQPGRWEWRIEVRFQNHLWRFVQRLDVPLPIQTRE